MIKNNNNELIDCKIIIIIYYKFSQFIRNKNNTHSPIVVTLDGIVTVVNTVDPPTISNMDRPMTVSPEIKDTSEREEHL